ncbi:MAG: FtsX-like permease family protein [bacterium]
MMLLKMAWRNLWKNRRRTLITMSMISIGFGLAMISMGLGDGGHNQMIRNAVRLGSGNLTVEHEDYVEEPTNDKLLADSAALAEEVRRMQGIRNVSERILVLGLIYTAENSVGLVIFGVDPANDMMRDSLEPKIVEGTYLKSEDARGIVMGADLARKLKVAVGGKAVITAQDASGQISSQLVRVQGIYRTGIEELDGYFAEINLGLGRALLGIPHGATQLAVFLENEKEQARIKKELEPLVSSEPTVAVFDWQEVMPELVLFVNMDNAFNYIFLGIILVIVALGILNTILMSVLERTREFGLMAALGLAPGGLVGLVVLETTLLALVALGAGSILGFAGHLYLARHGLDIGAASQEQMSAAGVAIDPIIYSQLAPERFFLLLGIAFWVTILVGIYPAVRAARVDPVRAMTKFK